MVGSDNIFDKVREEFGGSDANFARVRSLTTAEEDFRQLQELDRKIKSFQVGKMRLKCLKIMEK